MGEAHGTQRGQDIGIEIGKFPASVLLERAILASRFILVPENAGQKLVDAWLGTIEARGGFEGRGLAVPSEKSTQHAIALAELIALIRCRNEISPSIIGADIFGIGGAFQAFGDWSKRGRNGDAHRMGRTFHCESTASRLVRSPARSRPLAKKIAARTRNKKGGRFERKNNGGTLPLSGIGNNERSGKIGT